MMLAFAGTLGLLAQATALAATGAPPPKAAPAAAPVAPIRVWLADTAYSAGARARVFVNLRDAGYLTVLHVDPAGRIRVLFPLTPDAPAAVPGGATFEAVLQVGADGGTGTIVAARSRWPFQAAGLRAGRGPFWDYDNGFLFQPTAGDPLAALLDIADRVADGRPYDFDVTTYRTGGPLAARDPQLITPVCLGCVRSRPVDPVEQQSNVVIDQSNTVDCSSAYLVNSFCGIVDNRVTNTYVYNEAAPASEPIYVPYYLPLFIPRRRHVAPPPAQQQGRTRAIALRRLSSVIVPPAPRPRPDIRVEQPRQRYRPMEPRPRSDGHASAAPSPPAPRVSTATLTAPSAPLVRRYVVELSAGVPADAAMSSGPAAASAFQAVRLPERRAGTMSVPMSVPMFAPVARTPALVPSSGMLRAPRSRQP